MTNPLELQLDTTHSPQVDQTPGTALRRHRLLLAPAGFTPHQQRRRERPLAAGDQSHWDVSTSSVLSMIFTNTEGGFA